MRRRLFGETVEPPPGDVSLVAHDRAFRQLPGEDRGNGIPGQLALRRRSVRKGRGDGRDRLGRVQFAGECFERTGEVVAAAPEGEDDAALPDEAGWLSRIGEEGDRLRNSDKDQEIDVAEALDRQIDGIGDRLHRRPPATPRHASREHFREHLPVIRRGDAAGLLGPAFESGIAADDKAEAAAMLPDGLCDGSDGFHRRHRLRRQDDGRQGRGLQPDSTPSRRAGSGWLHREASRPPDKRPLLPRRPHRPTPRVAPSPTSALARPSMSLVRGASCCR